MDLKFILTFSPADVTVRSVKVANQPPPSLLFFLNNWNKEYSNIKSRHLFNKTCWCLQMKLRILYFLEWYIAIDPTIFENMLEFKKEKINNWVKRKKNRNKTKPNKQKTNPQTISISINWIGFCFFVWRSFKFPFDTVC